MKKLSRTLIPLLVLATLLISACGAATPADTGAGKVQAAPLEFIGVIESISGDGTEWTFTDGQVITIDPSVVHDGPFDVGDTVKVEAEVAADGAITVTRVEAPSPDDNSNDDNLNDDNGNDDNSNDDNINDDNGNDDNSNDENGNDDNSNDDNGSNSNDDNGNDDNSGKGGGDDDNDDNDNDD